MSRDLILIAFAMLVWGLGEGMFFFFQPLYLQELGADPLQIGAILGAVGLAMTLAYLPAGYLSDRIGRRPLLILAWVIGALCTGVMALSRSLPIFIASMVLYGTTSAVTVPLNSYITAARGRFSVGRALTLISAFFNLGYILGPLIGGQVGQRAPCRYSVEDEDHAGRDRGGGQAARGRMFLHRCESGRSRVGDGEGNCGLQRSVLEHAFGRRVGDRIMRDADTQDRG